MFKRRSENIKFLLFVIIIVSMTFIGLFSHSIR